MAGYNYTLKSIIQTAKNVTQSEVLIPARVVDVILDDKHPEFKQLGSWAAIGVVKFKILNNLSGENSSESISVAYPLQSHIKHIPLKNEIVLILSSASEQINSVNTIAKTYYLDIINLWNHPHHNALPSNTDKDIQLGDDFIEVADINPMRPFEGDIIMEGRQGQSFRFSTNIPGKTPWQGTPGSPIMVISNGQIKTDNGFEYIVEDINNDSTSVYLTSDQKIPLQLARDSKLVEIATPSAYTDSQFIVNSNRIIVNAKKDSVVIAATSNLSTTSQNTYIESNQELVLESARINLGAKANESVLLGDTVLRELTTILQQLIALSTGLSSIGVPQVTAPANELIRTATGFITRVAQMKSTKVKVQK